MTLTKNIININICLIALISSVFVISCDKYPDPANENILVYTFNRSGINQKAFAGSYLNDSITTTINGSGLNVSQFEVHFDVIKGGGSVDDGLIQINLNKKAGTRWKLGTASNEQILRTSVYEKGGRFIGIYNVYSNGFRSNICDTVASYPEVSFVHMVADTVNNITFANSNGQLFKQGPNYFDWVQVESNVWNSVYSVEKSKNNIIYLTNQSGDLFKSLDHGTSWVLCSKPFPSLSNVFYLQVTNDGTIWANAWNNALRFSKDGGATWTTTNLPTDQQPFCIYSLSDGSIILLTFAQKIMRSDDGGLNWINLNVDDNPLGLYVSPNDDVLVFTQLNGLTIKRSIDRGDHFASVYQHYPQTLSIMWHVGYKRGDTYYLMIQGVGVVTTKDFISFTTIIANNRVFDLFMDHRGTIIGTLFNRGSAIYYSPSIN